MGKNLNYSVDIDPNSKLYYDFSVRKSQARSCKIQSKAIAKAADFYFYQTW